MTTISDKRITEASAMVYSHRNAGHVWICNDENGPIYLVRIKDGVIVGSFRLKGVSLVDPESLALDPGGHLVIGDIGDNKANRRSISLYSLPEPGIRHYGELAAFRLRLTYETGPRNAECLLIDPIDGTRRIVSKQSTGHIYLVKNSTLVAYKRLLPANVTDGCYSINGHWAFLTAKDTSMITVLSGKTFEEITKFRAPRMQQCESITAEPDGLSVLIGSEGTNSPIVRVFLPKEFRS